MRGEEALSLGQRRSDRQHERGTGCEGGADKRGSHEITSRKMGHDVSFRRGRCQAALRGAGAAKRFRRMALASTKTLESAMAPAASMGESSVPLSG